MSSFIKWPIVKLQQLAANKKYAIVGGPFGSNLVSSDYVTTGVPVVRGINLPISNRFECNRLVFVSEAKADTLKSNLAAPGDLVFTQRGTLGQVGIIPSDTQYERFVISQSQMKMSVDESKADAGYLYYYFRLKSTVSYIENHALQSGVPHINLGILKRLEVVSPPLKTQKKIAAILSAYDDLIENNKRRIALLEKMAEEIYREWFVRFRFPGYQTAPFEKGIPKGWSVMRVGELYNTSSGGTPSRKNSDNYDGEINWLKTGELKNKFVFGSKEKITLQGLESSSAKIFPTGTVVMAMYCAMPDITILAEDSSTNQACCAFISKVEHISYIYTYYLIKFAQHHMIQYAHGAAQQNLSQGLIKGFSLLAADKGVVEEFTKIIEPIFSEIKALMKMDENLESTKNMLLPRLISGKLSVEDLDIQFPPGMINETDAV